MIDNGITLFITDFVGMQPVNSSVSNAQTAGNLFILRESRGIWPGHGI